MGERHIPAYCGQEGSQNFGKIEVDHDQTNTPVEDGWTDWTVWK